MRANSRLNQTLLLYDLQISNNDEGYTIVMTHKFCEEVTKIRNPKLYKAIEWAFNTMQFRLKFEKKHNITMYEAMF